MAKYTRMKCKPNPGKSARRNPIVIEDWRTKPHKDPTLSIIGAGSGYMVPPDPHVVRNPRRRRRNPLIKGYSDASISKNISQLMREGYPQKQAVAIAYDVARKAAKQAGKTKRVRELKNPKSCPTDSGAPFYKPHYDREWEEWQVRAYTSSTCRKRIPEMDAPASDREDAIDTANDLNKRLRSNPMKVTFKTKRGKKVSFDTGKKRPAAVKASRTRRGAKLALSCGGFRKGKAIKAPKGSRRGQVIKRKGGYYRIMKDPHSRTLIAKPILKPKKSC